MYTVLKQTHLWTSWIRTSWCLQFIGHFMDFFHSHMPPCA